MPGSRRNPRILPQPRPQPAVCGLFEQVDANRSPVEITAQCGEAA